MKKLAAFLSLLLAACGGGSSASAVTSDFPDASVPATTVNKIESITSDFTYKYKVDNFAHRPLNFGRVVMLGDSLTDLGGWNEYIPGTLNRGISGDNSYGILQRLDQVIALKPKMVFLLCGTNDLYWGDSPTDIIARIGEIVDAFAAQGIPVTLQTVPPIRQMGGDYGYITNSNVVALDNLIRNLAQQRGLALVDLYHGVVDSTGQLRESTDGIHFTGSDYDIWVSLLKQHWPA